MSATPLLSRSRFALAPALQALVPSAGLALVSLAFVAPTAHAQTYTFESTSVGDYATLVQTDGGVTFTLTREGGAAFGIRDLDTIGPVPASFGTRTLSPFVSTDFVPAFIGNFSTALTGVSVDFGDYAGDSDSFTLQAFSGLDGTGTLLGSTTVDYGFQSLPIFATGSLSGLSGIQSIRFLGGSTMFPNSVYYDNVRVTTAATAVPEPGEWAVMGMLGTSVCGLMIRARRKASTKGENTPAAA